MASIKIIAGYHKGKVGEVIEEGTFNVFGREITGAKVCVGEIGYLVFSKAEYVVIGENDTKKTLSLKKPVQKEQKDFISADAIQKAKEENAKMLELIFG